MNREKTYEYRHRVRDSSRLIFLSDKDMFGIYKNGCSPSVADEYECIENSRIIKEIISDCLSKQEKAVNTYLL